MHRRMALSLLLASTLVAACSDGDETGGFTEETVNGPAPGKGDDASSLEFGEFDYFVPPAAALDEPVRRMITTRDAFERVFGESAPGFLNFDREWMVLVSAGEQSESGVTVSVDDVRFATSGNSLEVVTTTAGAGKDCETSEQSYRPFKLVTFDKPDVAPQAVRYYAAESTMECAASVCEADALSLLTATSEGVNYTSEGDAPFQPSLIPGAAAEAVDEASTARLLGEPEDAITSLDTDFDGWFDYLTEVDDPDDSNAVREAQAYEAIRALYNERFTNLRVLRVGEVEVHVYLIGETSCGDLAVLQTASIET